MTKEAEGREDGLMSLEKMDRSSPDLWQEKIPGLHDFVTMSETPVNTQVHDWARGMCQEDISSILHLSALSTNGMIMEIKKIYDDAYHVGVSEAKEMTRGKYMGIFSNMKKKSH